MFEVCVSRESQESVYEMLDMETREVLKIICQTPSYSSVWTDTSQHFSAESSWTLLHNQSKTFLSVARLLLSPKSHRCIPGSPV